MNYFRCSVCGNFVEVIEDHGGTLVCCGKEMVEIIPGAVDGDIEKHIPQYSIDNCMLPEKCMRRVRIQIGEVLHPMDTFHHIIWVELVTNNTVRRTYFAPGDMPQATFIINDDENIEGIFAYCNIHGLWEYSEEED